MDEQWLPVPGFPGYEVSDLGAVRSVDHRAWNGRGFWTMPGRTLVQQVKDGRMRVTLRRDRRSKSFSTHTLVTTAFLGPRPDGMEVCHNDGDATNNAITNLRYDTHSANERDKFAHGTATVGERNGKSVLTLDRAMRIADDPRSHRLIAADHGVSRQAVSDIKRGARWGAAMKAATAAKEPTRD